jgi:uncharacterized membrane protein
MARILSCAKCSFETTEELSKCSNCGGRLQSATKVRVLGWLLVGIGLFLVLFMVTLGIYLGSIISQTGEPGRTTRFSGGPEDVAFIVGIFGLVICFGLASIAGGVWQIIYGKPNRKVMVVMFVIAGLFLVVGRALKAFGS